MHLITLSALRRLISGVDITPGIIRQEYFFFHFITSLAIYVHLITISHLRQFPPVVWMSLYLFISDFFSSYYTQALVRELTSGVYTSSSRPPVILWIWRGRRGVPPHYSKKRYYTQLMEGPLRPATASQAPSQEKEGHWVPLDLAKVLPVTPPYTRGICVSCRACTGRG